MRKGFTLLELCVVVAVIAFAATLLFKVFDRAKAIATGKGGSAQQCAAWWADVPPYESLDTCPKCGASGMTRVAPDTYPTDGKNFYGDAKPYVLVVRCKGCNNDIGYERTLDAPDRWWGNE